MIFKIHVFDPGVKTFVIFEKKCEYKNFRIFTEANFQPVLSLFLPNFQILIGIELWKLFSW